MEANEALKVILDECLTTRKMLEEVGVTLGVLMTILIAKGIVTQEEILQAKQQAMAEIEKMKGE